MDMVVVINETPFMRLSTYGIYQGVAACRIEFCLGEMWNTGFLTHVIASHWYMFNLESKLAFGARVIIEGADKLAMWRLSLNTNNELNTTSKNNAA